MWIKVLVFPPQWVEILTAVGLAGYGNMSPSSTGGQIFCVFFALFGIPLNMMVLNRVGKYMLVIERNISDFLEGKTGRRVRRCRPIEYQTCVRSFQKVFYCIFHFFIPPPPPHLTAEVYPFFCPPGVLFIRSSSLLCCTHDCVPTAWGLDLLPGHLLLLHHPQHHRLRGLCGRYGTVITSILKHVYRTVLLRINWVFSLQIVIQTKCTQSGTVSSWPRGSSSAWPGWPCSSITPLTSWSASTPTSNSGGGDGCRTKCLAAQRVTTQTHKWRRKMRSRSLQWHSNVQIKVKISVSRSNC